MSVILVASNLASPLAVLAEEPMTETYAETELATELDVSSEQIVDIPVIKEQTEISQQTEITPETDKRSDQKTEKNAAESTGKMTEAVKETTASEEETEFEQDTEHPRQPLDLVFGDRITSEHKEVFRPNGFAGEENKGQYRGDQPRADRISTAHFDTEKHDRERGQSADGEIQGFERRTEREERHVEGADHRGEREFFRFFHRQRNISQMQSQTIHVRQISHTSQPAPEREGPSP